MTKDWKLEGRGALVTGCGNSLGQAIMRALSGEGVRVCAAVRAEDDASAVAGEPGTPAISVDFAAPDAAAQLADQAKQAVGRVDILVNAASAVRRPDKMPVDAPAQSWAAEMDLDFELPRRLTHALLPGMAENGWGRVINIIGPSEPHYLSAEYAASGALQGWSKGLCREIGPSGITINCIQPGMIRGQDLSGMYSDAELRDFEQKQIPARELGEPADVANLVVFLSSPLTRYVTGTVIPVDGGLRWHQN